MDMYKKSELLLDCLIFFSLISLSSIVILIFLLFIFSGIVSPAIASVLMAFAFIVGLIAFVLVLAKCCNIINNFFNACCMNNLDMWHRKKEIKPTAEPDKKEESKKDLGMPVKTGEEYEIQLKEQLSKLTMPLFGLPRGMKNPYEPAEPDVINIIKPNQNPEKK